MSTEFPSTLGGASAPLEPVPKAAPRALAKHATIANVFSNLNAAPMDARASLKDKKIATEETKLHGLITNLLSRINKDISRGDCYEMGMSKEAIAEIFSFTDCSFVTIPVLLTKEGAVSFFSGMNLPHVKTLIIYEEKSGTFHMLLGDKDNPHVHTFRPNYQGTDEQLLKSVKNELMQIRLEYLDARFGIQEGPPTAGQKAELPFSLSYDKGTPQLTIHYTDTLGIDHSEPFGLGGEFGAKFIHLKNPLEKIKEQGIPVLKSLATTHMLDIKTDFEAIGEGRYPVTLETSTGSIQANSWNEVVSFYLKSYLKTIIPEEAIVMVAPGTSREALTTLADQNREKIIFMPREAYSGQYIFFPLTYFDYNVGSVVTIERLKKPEVELLNLYDNNLGIHHYLETKASFLNQHSDILETNAPQVENVEQILIQREGSLLFTTHYDFGSGRLDTTKIDLSAKDYHEQLDAMRAKIDEGAAKEQKLGVKIQDPIAPESLKEGKIAVTRSASNLEYTVSCNLGAGTLVQEKVRGLIALNDKIGTLSKQIELIERCQNLPHITPSVEGKNYVLEMVVPDTGQKVRVSFSSIKEFDKSVSKLEQDVEKLTLIGTHTLSNEHLLGAVSMRFSTLAPPPLTTELKNSTELDELLTQFDAIDFEDKNSPFYRDPDALLADGDEVTVQELREGLEDTLSDLKARKPQADIVASGIKDGAAMWYDKFEATLRTIIYDHKQEIEAAGDDEKKQVEAIRHFQTSILSLAQATRTTSQKRWLQEATQLRHVHMLGEARDLTSVDVKEFLLENVDNFKLGCVRKLIDDESREQHDLMEASLETGFLYTLQKAGIKMPKLRDELYMSDSEKGLSYAEIYQDEETLKEAFLKELTPLSIVEMEQAELTSQLKGPYKEHFLKAFRDAVKQEVGNKANTQAVDTYLQNNGLLTHNQECTFKGALLLLTHYSLLE